MQSLIEQAWEERHALSPSNHPPALLEALHQLFVDLSAGILRVVEPLNTTPCSWTVHEWIKKALLLSFRVLENQHLKGSFSSFYDKLLPQYAHSTAEDFASATIRVVPPTNVRMGAYIGQQVILMPSFINSGAYIDDAAMIDSWATVGSCAYIGKRVHLSMHAGVGGVLEPLQALPTIIEDDCFIGAGSAIVEGVVVETGSIIGMGVFIGQSTKIYDREQDCFLQGRVPAGSVVVPGTVPSKEGRCNLQAAIIVKRVDKQTREKVGINHLLRAFT